MSKEINHEFTDEIVCPYCGQTFGDSWELPDSGREECAVCYKEFTFDRNVTVDYSTARICICDHTESIHFTVDQRCHNRDYINNKTVSCPCRIFNEVPVKEIK